jgi:hypothetical protein
MRSVCALVRGGCRSHHRFARLLPGEVHELSESDQGARGRDGAGVGCADPNEPLGAHGGGSASSARESATGVEDGAVGDLLGSGVGPIFWDDGLAIGAPDGRALGGADMDRASGFPVSGAFVDDAEPRPGVCVARRVGRGDFGCVWGTDGYVAAAAGSRVLKDPEGGRSV